MNFLKRDLKQEAQILRRRQFEEERKKRIFDPRTRLFGVDTEALSKQQQEKQLKEEREYREQQEYAKKKNQQAQLCQKLEERIERERKEHEKRISEFREVHQKFEDRSEFDLNDPEGNKKNIFSCSGVSRFDGEDETYQKRTKFQKEQSRAWLQQQMEEKRRILQEKQDLEERIFNKTMAMDRRAKELELLEQQCNRSIKQATAEFNKMASEEKMLTTRLEADKQAQIEAEEVKNWLTGDFLTENPERATSAFGPGKIIPYMYKGEPLYKTAQTKQEQLEQVKQKKQRAQEEQDKCSQWGKYEKTVNNLAREKVEQFMREQRELDTRTFELNSKLAEEQRRREIENNSLKDLKPTPAYFDQFNRSTY